MGALEDGPVTPDRAKILRVSAAGCRWRGTVRCWNCEYGRACPRLCDYHCSRCEMRAHCPCGWDDVAKQAAIYEEFRRVVRLLHRRRRRRAA